MKKILRMIGISGIMILPCCCIAQTSLQTDSAKGKINIAANVQYNKAGKFKQVMLGKHYRREWAAAVDIQVLNMHTTAGGLTPVKIGGGMQTKSLRLQGADGNEYVLRSVNKDPSKALVAELRGTFAEDLVQDQISSANPFAPIVVSRLSEAAGIFHNHPVLVYVPMSGRLGKYNETFAGTLCLFEERPNEDASNNLHYGNADKIINSPALFEKILANSDHQVDERAFVKARLFDILIGDWDRHEDQWLWAAFKTKDKTIYQPIPRDRDQAFPKMDGVIPQLATRKWGLRKIQDFDFTIRDVNGLNTGAAQLDRNFTTRLVLADWLSIAAELKQSITDSVIDSACALFPKAVYDLSGKSIAAKLKQRRNDLQQYAKQYYLFLSEKINITGTKNKELFEVTRLNDDTTKLVVYKLKKDQKEDVIFERIFLRAQTKEIRLYGLEGNDVFNITGNAGKGITVRIIGGKGNDQVDDNSFVKGWNKKTRVYDDTVSLLNSSRETKIFVSNDTAVNTYNRRSFKYDWIAPMPGMGYNPDDGIYIGGGVVIKKQGFGKSPWSVMHTIGGNYAFNTGGYNFWYKGVLKEFAGKWDLGLEAVVNAPNYSRNYYGLGNESGNDVTSKDYYRVRMDQVILGTSLKRQIGKKHFVESGIGFQSVRLEEKEGRFVSSPGSKLDSADFGRKNYADVKLGYEFNRLNNEFYPTKGFRVVTGASFIQNLKEQDKNFVRLSATAFSYTSVGRFTLATSSGVAANLGNDYEFFQANTLSGTDNLRGYRRDRFAGKTSIYSNTELRYNAGIVNGYFLKGQWGLLGFFDNGRVWMPDEVSDKWHSGYGGGLWFLPFNKLAFTATYAVSEEENIIGIKAGFLF